LGLSLERVLPVLCGRITLERVTRAADRLVAELVDGAGQGATGNELGEVVSRALAPVVAHDAVRVIGTIPRSGFDVAPFAFWYRYEPDFGRALVRDYFTGEDRAVTRLLVRQELPAEVVGAGCDGWHARLVRGTFAAHGVGCELRLVLKDSRGVWGSLGLLRAQGVRPFDADDVHRVARWAPVFITALRGLVTTGPLTPVAPNMPAGVTIMGADHAIRAATPEARGWWWQLDRRHPAWLREELFSGLSLQARVQGGSPLVCGPSATYGRWVGIQAQRLDDHEVAIVMQAPTAQQLLPSFSEWYGITAREQQIVAELCDAAAPKQIARRLGLSVCTVNDHLRSVFRKTGAGCRAELMSALNG
jgi:DNA-binding CsgD family transcriptional regulator